LLQTPGGRVDLRAGGAELRAVGEGAADELVHRELGAGLSVSAAGGDESRHRDERHE
jgi:hypothetical protein